MDSLTQAVLGAVVGELCVGRRLGWKAAAWGAWLGTVPDLDVLLFGGVDEVARLHLHRGLSHSLFFLTLTAPLWAWLIRTIHRHRQLPFGALVWMVWLALVTHTLVDCFTIYGVEVLQPFSHWRLTFSNLFVVDPLFTLPLAIGLLASLLLRRQPATGRDLCCAGVGLSLVYVGWSFIAQQQVRLRCKEQLAAQGIEAGHIRIMPTPGNTLLWRALASSEDTVWVGYAGLLDSGKTVQWRAIPRHTERLAPLSDNEAARRIDWFADGFSVVETSEHGVMVADLRFGEIQREDGSLQPMSVWRVEATADGRGRIKQLPREFAEDEIGTLARRFGARVLGRRKEDLSPRRDRDPQRLLGSVHFAPTAPVEQGNGNLRLTGLLCTP